MTIAFDTASGSHDAGELSLTWQHTCSGSDRILLVGVMHTSPDTVSVSSVTYHGDALTLIDSQIENSGSQVTKTCLYYMVAPDTGGAYDIVVTLTGNVSDLVCCAVSYTGVDQSNPYGDTSKATGGGSPTVDVTSEAGNLVVDTVGCFCGAASLAAGTGQTQRQVQAEGTVWCNGMSEEGGAASVTMSWTGTSISYWGIVGASLKPVSGGGLSFSSRIIGLCG